MKRIAFLLIVSIVLLSTAVSAFDGKLKGFVLGGGIGLTPTAHWKMDYTPFPNDPVVTEEDNAALGSILLSGMPGMNRI